MSWKTHRIVFWVTTTIFGAMMAFSGVAYLTVEAVKQAFVHLGFPAYFRVELAIFKLLGAGALLLPVPAKIKEWAYAGFFLTLISAVIAHLASGDGADKWVAPLILSLFLIASYRSHMQLSTAANRGRQ